MPVYTVKSLQDPTDLKYISQIGRVPLFIQDAVEDAKSTTTAQVPSHLVDSVANFGLCQLWPEFNVPILTEKRKRRNPLPYHPLLGMN